MDGGQTSQRTSENEAQGAYKVIRVAKKGSTGLKGTEKIVWRTSG